MQSNSTAALESLVYRRKIEQAKKNSQRPLWQPDNRNLPQCLAFEMADKVMEMGYGGEAGGGKTDLGLGLAATKFEKSLILRREFPQLETIITRGDEIFPTKYVGGEKKRWRYADKIVTLGSCQYEDDWEKYQGRPHDLLHFDEAAQFPSIVVRSIAGWNRSSKRGQHTLLLLTFNPPTDEDGEWIIEYFAPWLKQDYPNPAKSGEIRWFAYITDEHGKDIQIEVDDGTPFQHGDDLVYPISRTFIRARLSDNQHLGEDYRRRIDSMPEPLRSILKGDMTLRAKDNPYQVIPTAWVLAAMDRWEKTTPENPLTSLGVDVAYGGDDNTVISRLYGVWFAPLIVYAGVTTPNGMITKEKILEALNGDVVPIGIDMVGYGSSAYDQLQVENTLREANGVPRLNLIPINGGRGSKAKSSNGLLGFANLRAEMYWLFREALNPESGFNICLPRDQTLRIELCAPKWKEVGGRIQLESKDDIKKRLHRSPDLADAVVQNWHVREYSIMLMAWVLE